MSLRDNRFSKDKIFYKFRVKYEFRNQIYQNQPKIHTKEIYLMIKISLKS